MTSPASGPQFGPEEFGVLDYDARKIVLQCTNAIEWSYRLHAVQKEPFTAAFIDAIPDGSIFYDVGACVGSYALIAATRGLTTVAIEPSAPNYGALIRNAMLNDCLEHMLVLPIALAAGRGIAWLDYQDVRPGAASHQVGNADKVWYHRQRIIVWAMDELIPAFNLPIPTHMKIDTDGGESSVLLGMDQTLRNERLVGLMIEMPVQSQDSIVAFLAERGWELAERFTERDGAEITGILYGRFARPVMAEVAPEKPKRKAREAVAA